MRRNFDLTDGLCLESLKQRRLLLDLLAEHLEISRHVDRATLR